MLNENGSIKENCNAVFPSFNPMTLRYRFCILFFLLTWKLCAPKNFFLFSYSFVTWSLKEWLSLVSQSIAFVAVGVVRNGIDHANRGAPIVCIPDGRQTERREGLALLFLATCNDPWNASSPFLIPHFWMGHFSNVRPLATRFFSLPLLFFIIISSFVTTSLLSSFEWLWNKKPRRVLPR